MVGILLLAYRSLWLSVATVITISLGMILCGAFAALAVKELNLISVAFAVTNIGLGVEYAIHFCLRYKDNLMHHISREKAIRGTLIATSPSLLLCASTTAIGLYAFIPTDYQGVSELGLLAGSSLFICLSVTLIVLPVILKLIPINLTPKREADDSWLVQIPEHLAQFTLHYAKPITVIVGILAVLGLALLGRVETDFNPINLRDPNTDSVIAFKHLLKDKDTSPMTLSVLVDSEAKVKTLQQQLEALPTVEKTVSLYDFIPEDQDDKLAIIEQMSLTLGLNTTKFPVLSDDPNPVLGIEHLLTTLDTVLPGKINAKEIAVLNQFKTELQGLLLELNNRQQTSRHVFMETMQTTVIGTLPSVMNDLLIGLNADTVTLNDLPVDLKERWLSKDGQYRIQIYPKRDLNELSELERFITDVQTIAPDATDLPVLYWESMQAVVKAFEQAIAIAIITIAIVLYAIRRNLTDTLLIMTPLLLAGVLTMASTVLTHTPVNFANIIALPLLLGFGVDNGIHMVEKLRASLSEKQNIYQSSTARAMFYGALTTSSSFAGLAFSPHQGIASMGVVITIGIFWIMTSTFVILPALSKLVLKRG
ncbi:MMPL family transporter [Methylocucumis oryzae]|uniref:MMPL family transporter n=1 Tax=Methylocucumis oryzae TaxID=1632867 RepID=UPI001EF9EE85|nr:MMPL family transporter [Methylocucumis oryzae]